jgi:fructose-1,6-bisphosphatase/inositol monophosphatase family enzyme
LEPAPHAAPAEALAGRFARAGEPDEPGVSRAQEDRRLLVRYHRHGDQAAREELVARLLPLARDIRRAGAAALDLAWTAAGRLDAFYESGLNPWDWAAGHLLVEEAGGVTGWLDGDPPVLLAAATQTLLDDLRPLAALTGPGS